MQFLVIRRFETSIAGDGFSDIVLVQAENETAAFERVRSALLASGTVVESALRRSMFEIQDTNVDWWSYYTKPTPALND
jgi:hypothetical protein